jgi:hypothetical protein
MSTNVENGRESWRRLKKCPLKIEKEIKRMERMPRAQKINESRYTSKKFGEGGRSSQKVEIGIEEDRRRNRVMARIRKSKVVGPSR